MTDKKINTNKPDLGQYNQLKTQAKKDKLSDEEITNLQQAIENYRKTVEEELKNLRKREPNNKQAISDMNAHEMNVGRLGKHVDTEGLKNFAESGKSNLEKVRQGIENLGKIHQKQQNMKNFLNAGTKFLGHITRLGI